MFKSLERSLAGRKITVKVVHTPREFTSRAEYLMWHCVFYILCCSFLGGGKSVLVFLVLLAGDPRHLPLHRDHPGPAADSLAYFSRLFSLRLDTLLLGAGNGGGGGGANGLAELKRKKRTGENQCLFCFLFSTVNFRRCFFALFQFYGIII